MTHAPGSIQPHGALLAFDPDGVLVAVSHGAAELLGRPLSLGDRWSRSPDDPLGRAVREAIAHAGDAVTHVAAGNTFDVVAHRSDGLDVVELEPRPLDAPPLHTFAVHAQRSLARLSRATDLGSLFECITREVRELTGFDHVMFYRFRHDGSGEIVAEDRAAGVEPLLGLRYPALDLPPAALRLYLVNLLRFIADVDAVPAPIEPACGADSARPLDLTHAVLRSAAPAHRAYLRKMGVRASISISILVDRKLWGLVACHHYAAPKRVPPAVRASLSVLAQLTSARIEQLEATARARDSEDTARAIAALADAARSGDDLLDDLVGPDLLGTLVRSHGGAITFEQRVVGWGATPNATTVLALLEGRSEIVAHDDLATRMPAAQLGPTAGMLAVRYHERNGWIVWFRNEEEEAVRWGDAPADPRPDGPGSLLRRSHVEYMEIVRGRCEPWKERDHEAARRVCAMVQGAAMHRLSEIHRTRELLLAALSHDLKNPLNAIGLLAGALGEGSPTTAKASETISRSAKRMRRLIDQLLDFSRIRAHGALGVHRVQVDVVALVRDIVAETMAAFPGFEVEIVAPPKLVADVDPDRIAQAVGNLLSNARHHGAAASPGRANAELVVTEDVRSNGRFLVVAVRNPGGPLPEVADGQLFRAFNAASLSSPKRTGLGLGLFIVHRIVVEHGGAIEAVAKDGVVTFRFALPVKVK